MEIAKFQKSPEDLLSQTLSDLTVSLDGLKSKIEECARCVTSFFMKVPDSVGKEHELIENIQENSKTDVQKFYLSFHSYSEIIESYRDFFGFYKIDFDYWVQNESHLQKTSEDFRTIGESVTNKFEEAIHHLKKLIEEGDKGLLEVQETSSIQELEQSDIKEKRANRKQVSCLCVVFWLPRVIRRSFTRLSRRCRKRPMRSSSYETLVRQKSLPRESIKAGKKDKQNIEQQFEINSAVILACDLLLNSMRDVTNGMSYLDQELCRLDYLNADKEQHYEIMAHSAEDLIKSYSKIMFRLNKAECEFSKIINETGEIH